MATEFWAHHYDDNRRAGRGDEVEHEDEEFDEDEVDRLDELTAPKDAIEDPENWEEVPAGEGE